MNFVLISNILNLTGNAIVQSAKIINTINNDKKNKNKNKNITKNKDNISNINNINNINHINYITNINYIMEIPSTISNKNDKNLSLRKSTILSNTIPEKKNQIF